MDTRMVNSKDSHYVISPGVPADVEREGKKDNTNERTSPLQATEYQWNGNRIPLSPPSPPMGRGNVVTPQQAAGKGLDWNWLR